LIDSSNHFDQIAKPSLSSVAEETRIKENVEEMMLNGGETIDVFLYRQDAGWSRSRVPDPWWSCEL
jgi:hypothetical protein